MTVKEKASSEAVMADTNAGIHVVEIRATGAVVVFDKAFVSPDPSKVFGYSVVQERFRLFDRAILEGNIRPCLNSQKKSEALSLYYLWKTSEEGREHEARATIRRDTERQQKLDVLQAHTIECVEHITHLDNLAGILRDGLRPRNSLQHAFTDIADESVNARRDRIEPIYDLSIHDYVPFYFNAINPMLSRRRDTLANLIIIRVLAQSIICSDKQWLISDGNAASHDTKFYGAVEDLERLDWTCLRAHYWNDIPSGKRTRCAELLVHESVPSAWIVGIDCFGRKTIARATFLAEFFEDVTVSARANPFP